MGGREINARVLSSPYYLSPTPNQRWKLLRRNVIRPGLCGLFFLDWHLPHSVQLFPPCFICWWSTLLHQLSSIISSLMLSEESDWWLSWIHSGPITHLFPTLSSEEQMYWWVSTTPYLSVHACTWEYACTGNNIFSIRVLEKILVFFFLSPYSYTISLKSFFILTKVHEMWTSVPNMWMQKY